MDLKRKRLIQGLAAGVLLALAICVSPIGIRLEHLLLDLHSRLLSLPTPSNDVLLVTLDDASLDVMAEEMDGLRWPYPREIHAKVLHALLEAGAKAVAVDIIFDLPSGYGSEDDRKLAEVMRSKKVYLAGEDSEGVSTPVLSVLTDAGAITANAAIPVDQDAIVRWSNEAVRLPEHTLDAIGYYFGWRTVSVRHSPLPSFAEGLRRDFYPAAVPKRGLISYPSSAARIPRISYYEVYNAELFAAHRNEVQGKIVFVGRTPSASLTPQNQSDIFFTPVGFMPGVEIHGYNLLSLIQGRMRLPLPAKLVPFMLLIWLALLSTGFFYFRRLSAITCFAVATSISWEVLAVGMFSLGWIVPVLLPASIGVAMAICSLAVRYIEERDARLITRAQLFHYLPPRVAEHVLSNPSRLAMAGDRKEITLLFADVAGFTTLSEAESPEMILSILQSHLKAMAEAIFANDGTLDKYLGDGIMAFWGAPQAQDNQADLALKTALEMLRRVDTQNILRKEQGIPQLKLRIGLHTGDAIVGNIGSELFFDYTAIGNTVNTAARLEGANKPFATRLLISGTVKDRLSPLAQSEVRAVGRIAVQGRQEPIEIHTVPEPEELPAFDELAVALRLFDEDEIQKAREYLRQIRKEIPSFIPPEFYLQQLEGGKQLPHDEKGRIYWPLDSK